MNNKDLVGWFKAIAKWQTFYTYYQSYYYDGDIGKSNPSATTVNVPMVALQRYLSCRQVDIRNDFHMYMIYPESPINV